MYHKTCNSTRTLRDTIRYDMAFSRRRIKNIGLKKRLQLVPNGLITLLKDSPAFSRLRSLVAHLAKTFFPFFKTSSLSSKLRVQLGRKDSGISTLIRWSQRFLGFICQRSHAQSIQKVSRPAICTPAWASNLNGLNTTC